MSRAFHLLNLAPLSLYSWTLYLICQSEASFWAPLVGSIGLGLVTISVSYVVEIKRDANNRRG